MNRVSAIQSSQNPSDVIAERTKKANGNIEPIEKRVISAIVFRLWFRYVDHSE